MTTRFIHGLAVEIDGGADGDGAAPGDAVLCIHGLGGSSNNWTPLMEAFAGRRVIRPDLPGSARSALPDGALSIDAFAAALEGVLAALEIESVHLVAHSLGSIVAQHLAVRNPARVKSLALFGPLAAPPDAARPAIAARAELARSGAAGMQQIADAIVQGATSRETKASQPAVLALVRESVMRQPPEGYARSCEALAAAQAAAIETIGVPTLLVTGDQDGVAPKANVAAMAERIRGSRMVVLEGCGHWTSFEQPQACLRELRGFLAGLR